MSIDLALDTLTGDLDLTGGRVNFTQDRAEIIRQRLEARISLFKGTWFLDLTEGVDWLSIIGSKDTERARRLVLDEILADPDIDTATLELVVFGREIQLTGTAKLTTGETIEFSV